MVFNATFNNISVISWWSVLLVEELEKTTDQLQVTDKLYHIMLYTSSWSRFELTTSVVIGTDCIGSCKSNIRSQPRRPLKVIVITFMYKHNEGEAWVMCKHKQYHCFLTLSHCFSVLLKVSNFEKKNCMAMRYLGPTNNRLSAHSNFILKFFFYSNYFPYEGHPV